MAETVTCKFEYKDAKDKWVQIDGTGSAAVCDPHKPVDPPSAGEPTIVEIEVTVAGGLGGGGATPPS